MTSFEGTCTHTREEFLTSERMMVTERIAEVEGAKSLLEAHHETSYAQLCHDYEEHSIDLQRLATRLIYRRTHQLFYCLSRQAFLHHVLDAETMENAVITLMDETYIRANRHWQLFDPACGTFVDWYAALMSRVLQHREQAFWKRCGHVSRRTSFGAGRGGGEGSDEEGDDAYSDPQMYTMLKASRSFDELDKELIDREWVNDLLSHIGAAQRAMMRLHVVHGFPEREIATMLGSSESCVRAQFRRMLLFLREIACKTIRDERQYDGPREADRRLSTSEVASSIKRDVKREDVPDNVRGNEDKVLFGTGLSSDRGEG